MSIDGGLRPIFRQYLPNWMWTSIETGGTGRGIPDSHYLVPPLRPGLAGIDGWVEFKKCEHNKIPSYEPEQVGWHYRRARMGGRMWIAVRSYQGGEDTLVLVHGVLARELKANGLADPSVLQSSPRFEGGPTRWQWPLVAEFLSSHRPS